MTPLYIVQKWPFLSFIPKYSVFKKSKVRGQVKRVNPAGKIKTSNWFAIITGIEGQKDIYVLLETEIQ